jgi:HlyD family secretion protein
MKRKSWIYAGVGAVALVALLAWAFAPRPVEVEAGQVSKGRFETDIEEDGKTRLRDRYVVSAPLAGLLARPTLREGDAVEAGAVVATLTPVLSPLLDDRTLRGQQARLEAAEAQVARVKARVEAARVNLQRTQNEVARSEQLSRQGFISPTKLETDRLTALAAQKELEAASQERHIADHDVEQARAALMAVRSPQAGASARAFELRAPVAGKVLRVVQPSETAVGLGTPLLEIGDTRALEVVAELLTADALQAQPGSPVFIERWGGPTVLQGRVRAVEPAAFTKISALGVEEQRVKVLIDISSPPEQWQALGDGYRVAVRIVTQSVEGAVKLPVGATFPLPRREGVKADMGTYVVDANRVRLQPLEVAGRNGDEVWVRNGVQPGATVVLYPPGGLTDGARVKLRQVTARH